MSEVSLEDVLNEHFTFDCNGQAYVFGEMPAKSQSDLAKKFPNYSINFNETKDPMTFIGKHYDYMAYCIHLSSKKKMPNEVIETLNSGDLFSIFMKVFAVNTKSFLLKGLPAMSEIEKVMKDVIPQEKTNGDTL